MMMIEVYAIVMLSNIMYVWIVKDGGKLMTWRCIGTRMANRSKKSLKRYLIPDKVR